MPGDDVPANDAEWTWDVPSPGEPRWPATLAVLVALAISARLPDRLTPGPQYLVPVLELALLIPLVVANPGRITAGSRNLRPLSIALIALVNAANAGSLIRVTRVTTPVIKVRKANLFIEQAHVVRGNLLLWSAGGSARDGAVN
jgi:hypothetical protein